MGLCVSSSQIAVKPKSCSEREEEDRLRWENRERDRRMEEYMERIRVRDKFEKALKTAETQSKVPGCSLKVEELLRIELAADEQRRKEVKTEVKRVTPVDDTSFMGRGLAAGLTTGVVIAALSH